MLTNVVKKPIVHDILYACDIVRLQIRIIAWRSCSAQRFTAGACWISTRAAELSDSEVKLAASFLGFTELRVHRQQLTNDGTAKWWGRLAAAWISLSQAV